MGGKGKSGTDECIFNRDGDEGRTIEIRVCGRMKSIVYACLHDQDVPLKPGTGGDHSNSFNISTTSSR